MPLHAYGDTRDLGAMARFLCGPGAGYITGQDFAVDGGALAFGYLILKKNRDFTTINENLILAISI